MVAEVLARGDKNQGGAMERLSCVTGFGTNFGGVVERTYCSSDLWQKRGAEDTYSIFRLAGWDAHVGKG